MEKTEREKELENELFLTREHTKIFANAIACLLPLGQGIVIETSEESKKVLPNIQNIAVMNLDGKIIIDEVNGVADKKHGQKFNIISKDKNLN